MNQDIIPNALIENVDASAFWSQCWEVGRFFLIFSRSSSGIFSGKYVRCVDCSRWTQNGATAVLKLNQDVWSSIWWPSNLSWVNVLIIWLDTTVWIWIAGTISMISLLEKEDPTLVTPVFFHGLYNADRIVKLMIRCFMTLDLGLGRI